MLISGGCYDKRGEPMKKITIIKKKGQPDRVVVVRGGEAPAPGPQFVPYQVTGKPFRLPKRKIIY